MHNGKEIVENNIRCKFKDCPESLQRFLKDSITEFKLISRKKNCNAVFEFDVGEFVVRFDIEYPHEVFVVSKACGDTVIDSYRITKSFSEFLLTEIIDRVDNEKEKFANFCNNLEKR